MKLETVEEVRKFIRLCLNPGPGREGRSVTELVGIMPGWLTSNLAEHAPELAELRAAVDRAEEAAATARDAYADGLWAWIQQDEANETPRQGSAAELPGEVFKEAGAHDHWSWRCPTEAGGCGYESPWYVRTEADAQSVLDTHRANCRGGTR